VKITEGLKNWWQVQTGEEETPFDGDSVAFVSSMVFHICLLVALGLIPFVLHDNQISLNVTIPLPDEEEELEELELPQEFHFDQNPNEEIGANSVNGVDAAESLAPIISEISDIPNEMEVETQPTVNQIEINDTITEATGLHFSENLKVKGSAGQGTTGAVGAIDRITHEILLSLEERKTLVVWLFDQSGSLDQQRKTIYERFDRIYEELGVIEAAGNPAFSKYEDKPLLTSVMAFGERVSFMTEKPTDNLATIKEAVDKVVGDASGLERTFSATYMAAEKFKKFRLANPATGEPKRNVMLVVFTDEIGDDDDGLEKTIVQCRRYEMPVYVIGVPAPFGQRETMVKWVDPDPEFDQSPQWGRVNQGPESMMPERINLRFKGWEEEKAPIDSGFGPFSLTRLCYETGGIYFAVHPNRNVNRAVKRNEVDSFSAHLEHFFDPAVMRKYRPDYVSPTEYQRRVQSNKARIALVEAAKYSWMSSLEDPALKFVKRSEADLSNSLTEAQKQAAAIEPKIRGLADVLKQGESDRPEENSPRWKAGYDLAMGRVLAAQVRTEAYNAMLAKAKRGLNFEDPKNNTWKLAPADEITVGSQLEKSATKAKTYLSRVVEEHPGTPWALLAKRELEQPVGWKWVEEFTDLAPPNNGGGGGNANAPANDKANMIKKGPPKRKVPRL
jgi:hypothetical protein